MLLLPEHYPTEPYADASALLAEPARLRAQASEAGFLYFRGLLPTPLVGAVLAFVRDVGIGHGWVLPPATDASVLDAVPGARLEGRGWDDPRWNDLQHALAAHPAFRALASSTDLVAMLTSLFGRAPVLAAANMCWLKLPGSPELTTLPHRDAFYLPRCPEMWTVWVPLVETPLDVGPLGVVPRRHDRPEWPQADAWSGIDVPHDVTWATGAVSPGDVVVFDVRAVHCAWSNVSPTRVRASLDVRYEPDGLPGPSLLRPER